jgi:hypothetical protein
VPSGAAQLVRVAARPRSPQTGTIRHRLNVRQRHHREPSEVGAETTGPLPRGLPPLQATLLGIQQAAGNAAVGRALSMQRHVEARVDSDPTAERVRAADARPTSGRNLAVVYVAEAGQRAQDATALDPVWSDESRDPDRHAERLAIQAANGRYRRDVPPFAESEARVVRVYTELAPCSECSRWLSGNLARATPVHWTAPPDPGKSGGRSLVPNSLWQLRLVLLDELHQLHRRLHRDSEAAHAWPGARALIVGTSLHPDSWPEDHKKAEAAGLETGRAWKAAVTHVKEASPHPPAPAPAPAAAPAVGPLWTTPPNSPVLLDSPEQLGESQLPDSPELLDYHEPLDKYEQADEYEQAEESNWPDEYEQENEYEQAEQADEYEGLDQSELMDSAELPARSPAPEPPELMDSFESPELPNSPLLVSTPPMPAAAAVLAAPLVPAPAPALAARDARRPAKARRVDLGPARARTKQRKPKAACPRCRKMVTLTTKSTAYVHKDGSGQPCKGSKKFVAYIGRPGYQLTWK